MTWRVAQSLETLRHQFDNRYPARNKASDGGIGDAAHATRDSDHNPWLKKGGMGVVTARDFTHDPSVGMDIDRLTDELAASRDPRIKYIIANNWILDSRPGNNPWRWIRYHGSNPHRKHFHLSVMPDSCDDDRPWDLASFHSTPEPVKEPEGMALEETYTDWAGNRQSVKSTLDHLDKRLYEVHKMLMNPDALRPVIGPVVTDAVRAALGKDNEDQADAIVREISNRLGGNA